MDTMSLNTYLMKTDTHISLSLIIKSLRPIWHDCIEPYNQVFVLAQNLCQPLFRLCARGSLAERSQASFQKLFELPGLLLEALLQITWNNISKLHDH